MLLSMKATGSVWLLGTWHVGSEIGELFIIIIIYCVSLICLKVNGHRELVTTTWKS